MDFDEPNKPMNQFFEMDSSEELICENESIFPNLLLFGAQAV